MAGEILNEVEKKDGPVIAFLEQLQKSITQGFTKYYLSLPEDYKEHGFFYKEKQTNSFVVPAIAKATKYSFLSECPTKRKRKEVVNGERPIGKGFIDFWGSYENKFSFLIEVKHNWVNVSQRSEVKGTFRLTKGAKAKIKSCYSQLKRVRTHSHFRYCDRLFKIAMFILPTYYTGKQLPNKNEKGMVDKFQKMFNGKKINYVRAWKVPKRIRNPIKNSKSKFENYPFVIFAYRIQEF